MHETNGELKRENKRLKEENEKKDQQRIFALRQPDLMMREATSLEKELRAAREDDHDTTRWRMIAKMRSSARGRCWSGKTKRLNPSRARISAIQSQRSGRRNLIYQTMTSNGSSYRGCMCPTRLEIPLADLVYIWIGFMTCIES